MAAISTITTPQRVYWLRFSAFRGGDGLIIHSGDGFKAILAGEQQVKFREEN
jgi:hypothetical protein